MFWLPRVHFSTRIGSQEGTLALVFQQLGHDGGNSPPLVHTAAVWLSDIWREDVRWVIAGFSPWRRGFKSFVNPIVNICGYFKPNDDLISNPNQVTLVLLFWRTLHIYKCWFNRRKWACCCHADEAERGGDAADRLELIEVYCTLSSAVMKRTPSS